MHVGLNLIYLVPGETGGMEVVARELLPELLKAAPGVKFTAFINREAAAAGDGPWGEVLPAVTVPVNASSRAQWVLGDQVLLPPLARRHRIHLMHSLASIAPAWGPYRRVVTVHDIIYARFPETHAGLRDLGMRVLVPAAVRSAHRVIVDAHSTKHDLVHMLHAEERKIDVVPLGLGAPRRHQPAPEAQLRERLQLGTRQVILSLSAKRPHKNLSILIRALGRIDPERRPLLVLPGYPTAHEDELRQLAAAQGLSDDVRFLHWISSEDLEGLWGLTRVFVFPSLYEGFGLPLLEAMDRSVPVAASNASSLPEVAGDAALLFDPHDLAQLADAIERLLFDNDLRQTLIARGAERVKQFTWERTARGSLDSYARALGLAGPPASWGVTPAQP
ncbi:MAG TPA: glycosyltransferase family 1 protein [Solirubrobacteraceae bacterium]|jgi:glycosyltransferase involved in cell wall biosynthesis